MFTMIGYLTMRSNSWMNNDAPRDASASGSDLWAAVIGNIGSWGVGHARFRRWRALTGLALVRLAAQYIDFPRSSALFAPGFASRWACGRISIYSHWCDGHASARFRSSAAVVRCVGTKDTRPRRCSTDFGWIQAGRTSRSRGKPRCGDRDRASSRVELHGWNPGDPGVDSPRTRACLLSGRCCLVPTAWAAPVVSAGLLTATDRCTPVPGPIPPILLLRRPRDGPCTGGSCLIALGIALGAVAARLFRRRLLFATPECPGALASVIVAPVTALRDVERDHCFRPRAWHRWVRVGWATLAPARVRRCPPDHRAGDPSDDTRPPVRRARSVRG